MILQVLQANVQSGEYCYSPWVTQTDNPTIWSLSISITQTLKQHRKDGTHVPSSVLPSPTLTTQPFTPQVVRSLPFLGYRLYAGADLSLSTDAHHRFVAEECDWGFTRFVDLRKLYTPDTASGKDRPTIENDEVEITAYVRVLKDTTGVLWHNFVK